MSQTQTIFHSVDMPLDAPRDKAQCCTTCGKDAGAGDHFAVCSGCKGAAYCGRECQVADWKVHRSYCRHAQRQPEAAHLDLNLDFLKAHTQTSADALPALPERIALLSDWCELHDWAIQEAVHSSLLYERSGVASFDFAHECLVLDLASRPDSGGNPALAYVVRSAAYAPRGALLAEPQVRAAWTAALPYVQELGAHERAADAQHAGLLMLLVRIEGYSTWVPMALRHGCGTPCPARNWLAVLQHLVHWGVVVRRTSEESARCHLGRMKRRGAKWHWVQYTPEELVRLGLPADFTVC